MSAYQRRTNDEIPDLTPTARYIESNTIQSITTSIVHLRSLVRPKKFGTVPDLLEVHERSHRIRLQRTRGGSLWPRERREDVKLPEYRARSHGQNRPRDHRVRKLEQLRWVFWVILGTFT